MNLSLDNINVVLRRPVPINNGWSTNPKNLILAWHIAAKIIAKPLDNSIAIIREWENNYSKTAKALLTELTTGIFCDEEAIMELIRKLMSYRSSAHKDGVAYNAYNVFVSTLSPFDSKHNDTVLCILTSIKNKDLSTVFLLDKFSILINDIKGEIRNDETLLKLSNTDRTDVLKICDYYISLTVRLLEQQFKLCDVELSIDDDYGVRSILDAITDDHNLVESVISLCNELNDNDSNDNLSNIHSGITLKDNFLN
jgi:hypothetical protein